MPTHEDHLAAIRLLSSEAALQLKGLPYEHAILLLDQLAIMLKELEVNRADLDPIQRSIVLDATIRALCVISVGFEQAVAVVADTLRARYAGAENGHAVHDDQGAG